MPMWTLLPLVIGLVVVCVAAEDGVAQYQFSYHVKDDTTGQDFGQEEERQGYNTGGEYQVSLPDGRRQIVTYSVANPDSGYVADVTYTGEARYDERLEEQQRQSASQDIPVQIPALPPIRSKPSLPRAEKILRPQRPQPPSAEEVRFISRPTKIVPTVIKVIQVTKPIIRAPTVANIRQPKKIVEKVRTIPKTVSPKISPVSSDSPNIKKPISARTNSPKVSKASPDSPNIKKPISAFKSVPSTTTTAAPPPVYIPSKTPKLHYKDKYHTAESQVLYSLFREDINGKKMKPPPKKP